MRFNSEWLGALGSEGFIRLAGKYNVARMLERREFRQRFDAGQSIDVHEFLYPLAQAYDSVALQSDVELGGTDQLCNLIVGRDIMPGYGLEPQIVLTTPLLEGTDGVEKMSKSLGNYVGVTETPGAMFDKLMSISDDLMWRYYTFLTDLSPDEIDAEKTAGRPMASKLALARRIVADFHDSAAGESAEEEWRRVHQRKEAPSDLRVVAVAAGVHRPHHLLVEAGLAKSNGEAMRLLRQNAVRRDGSPVEAGTDIQLGAGEGFVLSVGPARHVRVRAS